MIVFFENAFLTECSKNEIIEVEDHHPSSHEDSATHYTVLSQQKPATTVPESTAAAQPLSGKKALKQKLGMMRKENAPLESLAMTVYLNSFVELNKVKIEVLNLQKKYFIGTKRALKTTHFPCFSVVFKNYSCIMFI